MTFLEKIKPHLISEDILIQETILHAINDYPFLPEDWTNELLKEAFRNKEKQSYILIHIQNQTFNEEAVKVLIENIPQMDQDRVHLAISLLNQVEPKIALEYRESLDKYIDQETWLLYELILNGPQQKVDSKFDEIIFDLDHAESFDYNLFSKAKKVAACKVRNGWVSADWIDFVLRQQLKEEWFSFEGFLNVYMIGLLKLEKYIPTLASLLTRDDDTLLEEVAYALISFQSDEVVREVAPFLQKTDSLIFASSIVENTKTDYAVQVLREAYRTASELEDQDLLIEALCHHFSKEALPEISEHMKKEYTTTLVDIEQIGYGYYSIIGEYHPELKFWKQAALERELEFNQASMQAAVPEVKVGRNDPCPCGSGKKYKKCCGK
ncbi:YecA family protein [Bacillus sp. USDA818B3_A]|uniref:YecA family protein n=1 Tax=Bacillus sp. USDA818B3_A TaxID=2698834 RepID=UPI00136AE709|nr:SEC-C metal-binding domain-containing protein [Bacillus sp. USDA818B3_A]